MFAEERESAELVLAPEGRKVEEEGKASRPRMEMCGFPDCQAGWGPPPQHCLTFWRGESWRAGERRSRHWLPGKGGQGDRRIGRKGGGHILFGGRMQERGGGTLTRTDRMREGGGGDCRYGGLNVDSSPSTPPTYQPSFVPSRDIAPSSAFGMPRDLARRDTS